MASFTNSATALTILVLGSGGREHAIAIKLAESYKAAYIYVAPGNGGTATCHPKVRNVAISPEDQPALLCFAKEKDVKLVVIGPEAPLVAGMKDAFVAANIRCFGPTASAARLEASKAFMKNFCSRHSLPTAQYGVFTEHREAERFVRAAGYPVVIKASGLAGGKGVLLPASEADALQGLREIMIDKAYGEAGEEVVVEQFLDGEEVSVLAFADGRTIAVMPPAQDHKRALDGDKGLNTGGMGAYAPAPVLTEDLRRECTMILQKTLDGMAAEGSPFTGVLYGGFIITKDGPFLLEYNTRFGDPEAQVLLPLLDTDLLEVLLACEERRLKPEALQWKAGAASTVVMAAGGYPGKYPKGMLITGLKEAEALQTEGVTVYHAGTKLQNGEIVANGGRVLAVTGVGRDLPDSLRRAYRGVRTVNFSPSYYRTDIGQKALGRSILLLGAGGREHALALKLAESPRAAHVYVAPGNGGTATSGPKISNLALSAEDVPALVAFAKDKDIGLVVIGPEAPLVVGASDLFLRADIPCFGPSAAAARLEASKAFSKDFFARHNIPTADYGNFTHYEKAVEFIKRADFRVVIKASGLAGGKGVLLPESKEAALQSLREVMLEGAFGDAGREVVIERFLEGEEVSVMAFADGRKIAVMPGAQDHKRALNGDKGLNTGGMGAYAPAPVLTSELSQICAAVLQRTVDGMAAEGSPYIGILYGGFMLTEDGPCLLEYNCRFGDPEAQVLLPLLDSDLVELCLACVEGRLEPENIRWKVGAAATVVLAAKGYPENYPKGMPISGLAEQAALNSEGIIVYHAGTRLVEDRIVASGGRVLSVTGVGKDTVDSLRRAYRGVEAIRFEHVQYRTDIGQKALRWTRSVKGKSSHMPQTRVAVLGSTRGSCLQAIIDEMEAGALPIQIALVISNRADAGILDRARRHDLTSKHVAAKGKSREDFDAEVTKLLEEAGVDLILLIGYMRILSAPFCQRWEGRCLNVHPSLLPDFAGGMDLEVHEAVIRAGKTESGCTVHLVTEEVDGGPVVVQERVSVLPQDSAESLKAKVQQREAIAFLRAIRMFIQGEIGAKDSRQNGVVR